MARTWSDCVSSSKKALARYHNAQFQIGIDAAEAIPPGERGVDTGITACIARYADEIGVEATTLERWRAVALYWSDLMKFPPAGGFSRVNYSVYRELQGRYGDAPQTAYGILKEVVGAGDPPSSSGRWTWATIHELIDRTDVAGTSADDEDGQSEDGQALAVDLRAGAAKARGNPGQSPKDTANDTSDSNSDAGSGDEAESAEQRIEAHLQNAWNEIPNLEPDRFNGEQLTDLRTWIGIALGVVKLADREPVTAAA